jgi:CheY-like chemotaxis protein
MDASERRTMKILVVEDDKAMGQVIKAVLNSLGCFGVTLAEDGVDAIDVVTKSAAPFELVISDLTMPKMDGLEFLKLFRAKYPGTPFVMLTATTDINSFNEAKSSGATYFFMKPLDPDDFKDRIESLLGLMSHGTLPT